MQETLRQGELLDELSPTTESIEAKMWGRRTAPRSRTAASVLPATVPPSLLQQVDSPRQPYGPWQPPKVTLPYRPPAMLATNAPQTYLVRGATDMRGACLLTSARSLLPAATTGLRIRLWFSYVAIECDWRLIGLTYAVRYFPAAMQH